MGDFLPAGTELGWRRHHWAGALGLRKAIPNRSEAEGELIRRYAEGATCAVEIGVLEGGSARPVREVMHPEGTLFLIDPFEAGRLGVSLPRIIARRTVGGVRRGEVVWLREKSHDAVKGWSRQIDFLFIDGDNSYEGSLTDWRDWSPHVRVGGTVIMQGARLADDTWVEPEYGPARVMETVVRPSAGWEVVDEVDAAVAVRRAH